MNIIKYIVVLTDVAILLILTFIAITEKFTDMDILIYFAVTTGIVMNLYFVFFYPTGEDWLALKLRRKALEEKQKINELTGKLSN